MPVPTTSSSSSPRKRPPMNSRACSYQDTCRYRSSLPSSSAGSSREDLPSKLRPSTPGASVRGPPPTPGSRPSPFFPGFWLKDPATSTTTTTPVSSIWAESSPSLTGKFVFETDSTTQAADSTHTVPFAFTVHANRNLSAHSRPGTPIDDAGVPIPITPAQSAERDKQEEHQLEAVPATRRKLMVAVDAADQEGLRTLDWACKEMVQPGDTLVVVRVVKEQKGFKGGYAAASEMMKSIESRAHEEADRITCHALRALGQQSKKCIDLYVKYRTGDPRSQIRELVGTEHPDVLIVGNNRKRVSNTFFHGGEQSFLPEGLNVPVVSSRGV
ncbi:hypothetical protein SpCBS45565_g00105 [Spizellomyces sp. 'palustris']|nr:hypothetical protein SpCBS45565_g00105 [Spizellomyces sp. 'palustris']